MGVVYGLYAPNAPNLIAPAVFGGAGARTAADLQALDVPGRFRPDTIVVVSPHWVSPSTFLVHRGARPRQVFDFSGFPPELKAQRYEPPGDPPLAEAISAEASRRGIPTLATEEWGLDHGAWAPLLHIAPGAKVPVVPVSITELTAAVHLGFGAAIAHASSTLGRRIALVATGSITHRLDKFDPASPGSWPEGEAIEREIVELALARRSADLSAFDRKKWRTVAPEGDLSPLFVLLGALPVGVRSRLVSTDQVFGAAGMSVLEFTPDDTTPSNVA